MLHVAICDHEADCIQMLKGLVDRLSVQTTCECFTSADALWHACNQSRGFDMVFWEIPCGGCENADFATRIRERLGDAVLIMLASNPRCITRAFKARPDQFLFKPVCDEDFFEAVRTAMLCRCRQRADDRVLFRCRGDLIALRQSEICYLEARGHHVQLNSTVQKPFLVSDTIAHEERRLSSCCFMKIHRSYLVNLRYVRRIEGHDAVMQSGVRIPISKGRYRQVCEWYEAGVEGAAAFCPVQSRPAGGKVSG